MRVLIAITVALLLYLQYVLWFGKGGVRDVRELERTVAAQQQQIGRLKDRNQALAAEVRDLKQGMEAIEEIARSEMGMIKDGEVFFQIVKPSEPAADDE